MASRPRLKNTLKAKKKKRFRPLCGTLLKLNREDEGQYGAKEVRGMKSLSGESSK